MLLTAGWLALGSLVGATYPFVPLVSAVLGIPTVWGHGGCCSLRLSAPLPPTEPQRCTGIVVHTGTPTPFANILAAERDWPPLENFLCAACFFLISGMHRGKRDKLICLINFVNIDQVEILRQSHVRDLSIYQHCATLSLS